MYYSNHHCKKHFLKRTFSTPSQEGNGLFKQILRKKMKEMKKPDPIEELRSQVKPLPRPIYGKGLELGGNGLSLTSKNRQVQTLERKFGDQKITGFKICRKPIHSGIRKALSILTLGKLQEIEKEMDYVQAFHLFLYVELENGKTFKIHKNAVIDVEYTSKIPPGSTCTGKMVKPIHTVKEMIMKAEDFNHQLYRYNATLYNCQNFILSLLKPIGYWSKPIKDFTMQDFSDLFTPATGAIAQGITDTAALFSRMIGKGLELPSGGNGLKLAGQPVVKHMAKPKIMKIDPIEKLRKKMGEGLELPSSGNGLSIPGDGLKTPSRKDINKFLKDSLRKEFKESHGHLDTKHRAKIIRNFSLHKDEKSLKEHSNHLAKQLVKHYFPQKKGSGVLDPLLKPIGDLLWKAIKEYFKSGHPSTFGGSGKKKKSVGQWFKKAGKYLLDHRSQIAKAVKTGADIGTVIAAGVAPEAIPVLKGISKVADIVGKV